MPTSLASRLKVLVDKNNKSSKSNCYNTTSIATFLDIYESTDNLCRLGYMQGARDLFSWLRPFELDVHKHPEILDISITVPKLFISYELVELAKIMSKDLIENPAYKSDQLEAVNICMKALYYAILDRQK